MCIYTSMHAFNIYLSMSLWVLFSSSGLRFQFSMVKFILASLLLYLKLIILTVSPGCHYSDAQLWPFVTLWAVTCQAPLSMRLSQQVWWSEGPFPPPGDLPDPGIEPVFLTSPALACGFFLSLVPPRKPLPEHIYLTFSVLEHTKTNFRISILHSYENKFAN